MSFLFLLRTWCFDFRILTFCALGFGFRNLSWLLWKNFSFILKDMRFDYWAVVRKSWEIAWRYKILWIFGFFVGWSGSSNPSFNINLPSSEEAAPPPSFNTSELTTFFQKYLALIILVALLVFFFMILLLIARYISKPALIYLASKCDEVKPSFSKGFSAGLHFFFRYIATGWILWIPFVFILLPILIIPFILIAGSAMRNPSNAGFLAFLLLLFPLVIIIILIAIPLSVLTEIAHRYLVVEDARVFESISQAFSLIKTFWKNVALLWLIQIALGFLAVFTLIFAVLLFLLPSLPIILGMAAALSSQNIALFLILLPIGLILLLILVAFFLLIQGLLGTFFTNFWTLAYIKLKEFKESQLQEETSPQAG